MLKFCRTLDNTNRHICNEIFLKFCWRQHIFAKFQHFLIFADVIKILNFFYSDMCLLILSNTLQNFSIPKSIQSKVIQKISFADVSIFAFFATIILISLFGSWKHLSNSTFQILHPNTLPKMYEWTPSDECYWW